MATAPPTNVNVAALMGTFQTALFVSAAFATKPPKRVVEFVAAPLLVPIGLRGGAAFGPVTGVGYLDAVAGDVGCGG